MTLRLILMRHAKSSYDDPRQDDFDRPLNGRGRKAAAAIGAWLAQNRYQPELVLCSAAARTRETLALLRRELPQKPREEISERLYLASPETMFQMLSGVEGPASVMVIAHNPGIAALAHALCARPPTGLQFRKYPTAATTVLGFEAGTWNGIAAGAGQLAGFTVPRQLLRP